MNKKYLTNVDFINFTDAFSQQYNFYNNVDPQAKPVTPEGFICKDHMQVKTVTFVVTETCNLNCSYCYEKHKTSRKMDKETAFKAIDMLFQPDKMTGYVDHRMSPAIILEFIGGEPLLEIELMNEIVDYFLHQALINDSQWFNNYMISISTNGILYNDPRVQEFLKKNPGRISIGISIDGNKDLHDSCRVFHDGSGSYDIVEKAIKSWMGYNPKATTKLTLAPENIHHFKDSVIHLKNNLGISGIYANCVYEEGWNVDHAKILYQQMKDLADEIIDLELYDKMFCSMFEEQLGSPKSEEDNQNWCGGDGQMLAISVDGKFYPCIRYIPYALSEIKAEDEFVIGDIQSGITSFEQSKARQCLNCITRKSQSTDECYNCPIGEGCAWCTAYHYDKFGDPNVRATYICIMHKARVLANVYYWNKLYKKLDMDTRFAYHMPDEWALSIIDADEIDMLKNIAK